MNRGKGVRRRPSKAGGMATLLRDRARASRSTRVLFSESKRRVGDNGVNACLGRASQLFKTVRANKQRALERKRLEA